MVLCKLTRKMFHKSLILMVRNLSLILRLNIPPNSKDLVLPVLEVTYNSDLFTNFLEFYAFDMQIATFPFFTSLLDSVLLLLLEVINLISSGFPLLRFAHLFLVLNSTLSFLKMKTQTMHLQRQADFECYFKHTLQNNITSCYRAKITEG